MQYLDTWEKISWEFNLSWFMERKNVSFLLSEKRFNFVKCQQGKENVSLLLSDNKEKKTFHSC